MTDTVLFDLDGTLLPMDQNEFVEAYLRELSGVFINMGLDAKKSVDALWKSTAAMMQNDGSRPNKDRFWACFAKALGLDRQTCAEAEAICDEFYSGDFNNVKRIVKYSDAPKTAVEVLKSKGYRLVLATSPLFPKQAVESRLGWVNIDYADFELATDYSNSSYCKNQPMYYESIVERLSLRPENCLMVGNNTREDMSASALGMETYLVTGYVESEPGEDISAFRRGSIEEFLSFARAMPHIGQ